MRIFLAIVMIVGCFSQLTDAEGFRSGKSASSEVWSGDIYLVGDFNVLKEHTVTVNAGTHIYFANFDTIRGGKDPTRPELVVDGKMVFNATEEAPILWFGKGNDGEYHRIPTGSEVVEFRSYQVDVVPMQRSFDKFKWTYFSFWSLVYALWVLR